MRVFGEGLYQRFTQDNFLNIQENYSPTTFSKTVLQMSEQKSRDDEFDYGIQYHQTLISSLITKLNQRIERLNNVYGGMLESVSHRRVPADGTHTVVDGMTEVPKPQVTTYVREGHTLLDQELQTAGDQMVRFHGYNPYFGSYAVNSHDDTLIRLDYKDQKQPESKTITDYGAKVGNPVQAENFANAASFPQVPEESWIWRNDSNHGVFLPPTYFNYTFKLGQISDTPAVVTCAVDDVADIYLNGEKINPAQIRHDGGVATFNVDPSKFRLGDNMIVIKWERDGLGGDPDGVNFHMVMPDGTSISTAPYPEGFIDYDGDGGYTRAEEIILPDSDGNNNGVIDQPGVEFEDWNGNGVWDNVNAEYDPDKDYNLNGQYDTVDAYGSSWFWTEDDILTNPPMKDVTISSPPSYQENGAFWTTIGYLWQWDLDRINAGYRSGTVDVTDATEKTMINTTVLQPNRPIKPVLKVGDRIPLQEEVGGIRPGGVTYTNGQGYQFDDRELEAIVTSVRTNPDGTTVPNGWTIVYEGGDPNNPADVPTVQGAPKKIIKETISRSFDYNTAPADRWTTTSVVGGAAGWYEADMGSPGVWPVSPGSDPNSSGIFSTQLSFANTLLQKAGKEEGTVHLEAEINDSAEIRLAGSIVPTWDPPSIGNLEAGVYFGGGANTRYHAGGANGTVTSDLTFDASSLAQSNNLIEIFVEDTHDVGENFKLIDFDLTARAIAEVWPDTPRYTVDEYGNIYDALGDGFQEDPAFYVDTEQLSNTPNKTYQTPVGTNADFADDFQLWDYVPDVNDPLQVGSFVSNFFYYRDTMADTSRYTQFVGDRPASLDPDLPNTNTAIMPHLEFDGRGENRFGDLTSPNRVVVGNPTAPTFGQVVLGYVEQDQAYYNQILLDKEYKSTAFWRDVQDGVDIVGRSSETGQVTENGGEPFRVNDALVELHLFNKQMVFDPGGVQREVAGPAKKITKVEVVVEGDQPIPENDIQRYSTDWSNTDADGTLGNTNLADDWAIKILDIDGNEVQGTIQGGGLDVTDGMKLSLYLDRSMAMSSNAPVQVKVYYDDLTTETIGQAGLSNDGGAPSDTYEPDYYNYLVVGEGRSGGSYDNSFTQELKKLTNDPEFLEIMKYGLLEDVYVTASSLDPYNDMVFGKLALSWEADKRRIKVRQLSFMATWHS